MYSKPSQQRQAKRSNRARRRRRNGGAAVEAAFCFPLIIILMMGTLEVCLGIYLKESITICAFEGARVGVRRRGTAEEVLDTVQAALADRQVTVPEGAITITPPSFGALSALDPIRIEIVAPTAGNSLYIFDRL